MSETDLWFGTLSATVRVEDLPASRQVVAIERQGNGDWRVCGQAVSNAEGIATLPITGLPTSRIYAIAIDEWGKPFAPGMPVAYGDVIRPTQFLGWMYQVTSPGVLPGTEPEWWNSMAGVPQPVGTAMMQAVRHYQPVAHGPVSDIEWVEQEFDPHWDKVVSLLHFDGDLTDEKGNAWTGPGLIVPDGRFKAGVNTSAAHIQTPTASWNDLSSGQGDFTVEMFIKQTAPNTAGALIAHLHSGSSGRFPFAIAFGRVGTTTFSNQLYFGHFNGSWIGANSTWEPVSGQWHHIAASRDGAVYRLFADGVLIAGFTNSAAVAANGSVLYIGRRWDNPPSGSALFQGVIDELRITKGVARYTGNFDPPTAPFPNVGQPL